MLVITTARLVRVLENIRDRLTRLENRLMDSIETVQAAVDRNGDASRQVVTLIVDQRGKLAALARAVEDMKAGQVDPARLAAIAASLDANTDAMAQALAPVVEDPATPTGDVEVPAEQNLDTPDPGSVDGAVPAGEPLPAELG